jgi:hypothetical protein
MELFKGNPEPLRACCGLAIPFLRPLLECPHNDEDWFAVHLHGARRNIVGHVVISLSALWHFSTMYELPSLFDGKSFMGLYKFISSFFFFFFALELICKPIIVLPCYPVFYCP